MSDRKDYNDTPYLDAVASQTVPGLFQDFPTAATLVRMAKSELKLDLIQNGPAVVDEFYELLNKVEAHLKHPIVNYNKFIVEVEGLDGSGKTTLVEKLQASFDNSIATKTPTASLKAIRPLWDHRGGIVARAFYTLSNYILEYEIHHCIEQEVVIIDRWYASTCAYTVAYREDGSSVSVENYPDSIFAWPKDLKLRPNILLVLQIDPEVRQARVDSRSAAGGGGSRFNPWDDRLAKDVALGGRILQALNRMTGPLEQHPVNANASQEQVLTQALGILKPAYQKHLHPEKYFAKAPMEWWKLDINTASEQEKKPPQLQMAYSLAQQLDVPPILDTVNVDGIDINGISFDTTLITTDDPNTESETSFRASAVWKEWTAQGILLPVYKEDEDEPEYRVRFLPISIELSQRFQGGKTWEWSRKNMMDPLKRHQHYATEIPRSINYSLKNMTIAIMGTHTAGKSTIGADLAKALGCKLDSELGADLRDSDHLVASGHLYGSGNSTDPQQSEDWDDRIHRAECRRDEWSSNSNGCRVVETWHLGNAAWYQLRQEVQGKMEHEYNIERYKKAISQHQESSVVLMIQLTMESSAIMVRRRAESKRVQKKLPMLDEHKESKELFEALQCSEMLKDVTDALDTPLLQVDNGQDGEQAQKETLKTILSFVEEQYHRRVVLS